MMRFTDLRSNAAGANQQNKQSKSAFWFWNNVELIFSGMGGRVEYSLSGADSTLFSIDSRTGDVYTRKVRNFYFSIIRSGFLTLFHFCSLRLKKRINRKSNSKELDREEREEYAMNVTAMDKGTVSDLSNIIYRISPVKQMMMTPQRHSCK